MQMVIFKFLNLIIYFLDLVIIFFWWNDISLRWHIPDFSSHIARLNPAHIWLLLLLLTQPTAVVTLKEHVFC